MSCSSSSIGAKSSEVDSVSYAFGINIGESLGRMNIEGLNAKIVAKGIADMIEKEGANAKMTNDEAVALLNNYFQKKQMEAVTKNLKEGEEFLAKNKNEEGVKTTESGLQYKVTTEGSGPKPAATDEVEVHYRGTTLDGKEFDSSYERGEPAKFRLDGVIRGWTEGLQLVNEGSKVTFWIPSDLAYGEQGAGGAIGPNSTLIFEVELLKVVKEDPKAKK